MAKTAVSPESAALAQVEVRTRSPAGASSGVVLDVATLSGSGPALQAYIEGVLLLLEARALAGPGRWKQ